MKKIKKWIKSCSLFEPLLYAYRVKKYNATLEKLVELNSKCVEAGVKLFVVSAPVPEKIKGLSQSERNRVENWVLDFNNVTEEDMKILNEIYPEGISRSYIDSVYCGTKIIDMGYKKKVADFSSELVNFKNGVRLTPNNPAKFEQKVFIFGQCTARGTGVEDRHTIASFLQEKINEDFPNRYCVYNMAIGCGSTLDDDLNAIKSESFKTGDVIIIINNLGDVLWKYAKNKGIFAIDSSCVFDAPHAWGQWFTDETYHTNQFGNKAIGYYIYEKLCQNNYLNTEKNSEVKVILPDVEQTITILESEEFKNFKEELERYRENDYLNKKNGAIVMNCNPFTLGHRYLIETASKQVDKLYIFVVEEDKSVFPFKDRLELVKKGTADLKNVCVLPSGKFIISALTFPGYFYKDNLKETSIDTSNDIDIFGRGIAPVLNISVRFAGEEPLDVVTRQYNRTMEERLPLMNIEFKEIKRKEQDAEVISASRVRQAIKEGNWEMVEKIVPITTYEYLRERFRNE